MNYSCILKKIETDINRWMPLPSSVPARISVVKMNVLPRINFIHSMLPLSPSIDYWKKLDSLLKSFIWNKRHPRIKRSALQLPKSQGDWALPNFKLHHWSFTLQHLRHWLDPEAQTSWTDIERGLVAPARLQDYLFSRRFNETILFKMWPNYILSVDNIQSSGKVYRCGIEMAPKLPPMV